MHFARNYTCGRTAFMGDIVQYTSPYLFPFVIEYSFIAAAVLIAMWKSVGKNPRCASHLWFCILVVKRVPLNGPSLDLILSSRPTATVRTV